MIRFSVKKSVAWVGCLLLVAAFARADVVVVQRVEEPGRYPHATEITIKIKGAKVRADVAPETSTITDTATGETVTLNHSHKAYMKISADAAQELAKQMERARAEKRKQGIPEEAAKLEATGKQETVGGYETKIYAAQIGALKMTYWIAKNYPEAEKFLGVFNQLQKTAMAKLARDMTQLPGEFEFSGIPVKTEMATPDGRKIVTTLVSMKEQPLEDMDFTIPSDYHALPTPLFGPSAPHKIP